MKKSHWYSPDSFISTGAENATSVIYHRGRGGGEAELSAALLCCEPRNLQ